MGSWDPLGALMSVGIAHRCRPGRRGHLQVLAWAPAPEPDWPLACLSWLSLGSRGSILDIPRKDGKEIARGASCQDCEVQVSFQWDS